MCSFSPARAMYAVVLSALLFLPELHCENLLCYYCPLLPKSKACRPVLAECPRRSSAPQPVAALAAALHWQDGDACLSRTAT
ncbi:hypothetical protein GJAV_G00159470 [Gymnothorax javanicus]|nr:hypothetical protein GJAV_G00159470 [Gymnothorax javanicus]